MKKAWRIMLLLAAVIALLTCAAFAAEEDVTFSYREYGGSVTINGITIAETAEDPVDVEIPATIAGMPVVGLDLQGLTPETAAKIKTLDFAGTVPGIYGSLFRWKYENQGLDIASNGYRFALDSSYPDTNTLLVNIPAFVTEHYNYDSNGDGVNDTYYAGMNLVRVNADYSGDLIVKDGTVSILASAMEGCANLGAVTLPDSVEWIGVRAFANSGVTSVNLPAGLLTNGSKEIQMQTFFGCTNLQTVTFPAGTDKLTKAGYQAFYNCCSLTGFDFTRVSALDTLSFAKAFAAGTAIDLSQTSFLYNAAAAVFSHSGVGSVTFGEQTGGTVPFEAFYKCASLTQVNGMKTIGTINAWAFADCTSLAQDVLADCTEKPLDLRNAYRAFANNAVTEITFPATVTNYMAGSIFFSNEQLETVNWYSPTVSSNLFAILNRDSYFCWTSYDMPGEPTGEYTLPKTLNVYAYPTGTYYGAFCDMPSLETINVLCEITSLPNGAFQFCPKLKEITFAYPEKITSIGYHAFGGCLSLTSFPFTEMTSLESIGQSAFMLRNYDWYTSERYNALSSDKQAYGLKEIDLSQCTKLTSIGEAAFYNQYSVTKLHLPAGCYTGNTGIFHGTVSMTELICDGDLDKNMIAMAMITSSQGYNDNLETVTVNGQVVYSGRVTFFGMDALKTVNLPNAKSIPQKCFMNCTALETVYAPRVETVENCAFFGSGLKETVVSGGVTYGDYVFINSALEKVVVEEGVTELGDFMFEGCTALAQVSLPSTLETVNWAAFKNANASVIEIPASVTLIEDDAFCSGSFSLVFRGAPAVELEHPGVPGSNTLLPINGDATIYYTTDGAKRAAEVYTASLAEDAAAPAITEIGNTTLIITDAPTRVTAGNNLKLNSMTVTYGGIVLTSDQYTVDYDASDWTVGPRTVTVTVIDNSLPAGLLESSISARSFSGENVSGKVYEIRPSSDSTGTFTVEVTPRSSGAMYPPTNPPVVEKPAEDSKATVLLQDPVLGGSVTVFPKAPAQGDVVTITPVPENGYVVDEVLVTNANGAPVAVIDNGDGTYSFIQPAGNVNVRVTFTEDNTMRVFFVDVPADAYYYDAVQWAVKNGITGGVDAAHFAPDAPCTRAQMVTFLWRAAGCPEPEALSRFADVSPDAYYARAVAWAVENGITSGVGSNRFAPDDTCTRAQMAAFLFRMAGGRAVIGTSAFTDVSPDAYYAEAVQWAVENGITRGTGDGTTFSPDETCTRGQMVTVLYRFFVK